MMDSLATNTATPPHLRSHRHIAMSSRVPYNSARLSATASSPSADCREAEEEELMFQLDLEDDKLASGLACGSPKPGSHMAWSHYTSRLPAYSVAAPPLRPATASPTFHYRSIPLVASPSAGSRPMRVGSVQPLQRASLSPTIPTLSSRMRSSTVATPTNRTAVPSPSARLIKPYSQLSPAASTTSSSSCESQCSSVHSSSASDDDDDDCPPPLDYHLSPSPPSPASPLPHLTSSRSFHLPSASLPIAPAMPRATTLPATTKAQQWRADKRMSVQAGSGGETKRGSVSINPRLAEESDIGTFIFELEL